MVRRIMSIVGNKVIFTCVALVVFLLDTILLVHDYTGPFIKMFIIWGAVVIAIDFFDKKALWKTKPLKWLLMFSASYLITTMTVSREYLGDNLKILIYMVLFFVILYGHNQDKTLADWKKELRTVMLVFVWAASILATICIITFVFSINYEILTRDGYMHIGMYDNRLWGLYNPNAGACINVAAIFCAIGIGMSTEEKKRYKKVLLVVAVIIHYMCLILTSSRASLYSFIVCVGSYVFLLLNAKNKSIAERNIKAFLKNTVLAVLMIVILWGLESPIKQVAAYVPGCVNAIFNSEGEGGEIIQIELTRVEELEDRDGGLLTGRTYLWKAGLKALKQSPLFGISKAATYDCAKDYIEDAKWLEHLETSLHNVFITVLVASGIVGLVLFIIFLLNNIFPMVNVALLKAGKKHYELYVSCIMIIASLLVIELVEARIIYRTEVFNVIFWTVCGFAYNYVEIINRGELDEPT